MNAMVILQCIEFEGYNAFYNMAMPEVEQCLNALLGFSLSDQNSASRLLYEFWISMTEEERHDLCVLYACMNEITKCGPNEILLPKDLDMCAPSMKIRVFDDFVCQSVEIICDDTIKLNHIMKALLSLPPDKGMDPIVDEQGCSLYPRRSTTEGDPCDAIAESHAHVDNFLSLRTICLFMKLENENDDQSNLILDAYFSQLSVADPEIESITDGQDDSSFPS